MIIIGTVHRKHLREVLRENGVDVTVDNRAEKIGYKIREEIRTKAIRKEVKAEEETK